MIRIGLTGSFGSGKSTVLGFFKKRGIPVISCDGIVKQLLKTKKIKKRIEEVFGKEYFTQDGKVDKKKLAALIFSSAKERVKLNGIIHPYVFEKLEKRLDIYRKKGKIAVVIEIPLLFETRSQKLFDVIISVFAPRSVIKERLQKKYSPEEVDMRLKSQMPIKKKIRMSDYVIDNSGSIIETRKQFEKILEEIIRRHLSWQRK
ncbi:MAG: dephospho-CoA kinase [Candidatus Omnitrophica bacterium]|nr:dephospho-CoA kinase [Candidatus Omnitrophota bacterium]